LEDLSGIVSRALAAFSAAGDAASLENAKARFVGKSGELTSLQATLKSLSPEQKRTAGIAFNGAPSLPTRSSRRACRSSRSM
jgi:phenylalanyl-tRNA synthetase alpha chain